MAKKKVVVLLRRSPLNSTKNAEALRQSVGLTMAENDVVVLLVDAAAWLAAPMSPQIIGGAHISKPIDVLKLVHAKVKVEAESLARYGVDRNAVVSGVEVVDAAHVLSEITNADAVIPF